MAAPAVQQRTESVNTSASTSLTINFTQTTGDRVVIFLALNDTAQSLSTVGDSFTNLTNTSATFHILTKVLDGSEGGNVVVTVGTSTKFAAIAYNISGHAAGTAPVFSTVATGTSTAPNSGSLSPTGGSKDYLWLSAFRQNGEEADDDTWCSAAPSTPGTFTNLVQKTTGTSGLANTNGSVASAEYASTTATVDPGAFTVAQSLAWRAYTVAIYPDTASYINGTFAIGSAEAFGTATVKGSAGISPSGIGGPGGQAPALVQLLGQVGGNTAGATTTVLSSINKTVTAGNKIYVGWAGTDDLTVSSVTDNLGNSYSRVERTRISVNTADLWAAEVTVGGTITTITANHVSTQYTAICAAEFSGVGTLSIAGGGLTGTTGTTVTWADNKTIPANGFAVGIAVTNNDREHAPGSASGSPSTSISEVADLFFAIELSMDYAIASGAEVTGFSGTTTLSTSGTNWAGAGGIYNGAGVAFGTPNVTNTLPSLSIQPSAIGSAEAFGTATLVRGGVTVLPTAVDSLEVFGTATVSTVEPQTIVSSAIGSTEAFGTATILRGNVNLVVTSISSTETFGTATFARGTVTLQIVAITTSEALGAATVARGGVSLQLSGLNTTEAFGTAILRSTASVLVTGVTSSEGFGTTSVIRGSVAVVPTGIASVEVFGAATLLRGSVTAQTSAIASAEAFGSATISMGGMAIQPSAIDSVEAFGTATLLRGNVNITVTGISSAEAFGTTVLKATYTVVPTGIATGEAFGTATLLKGTATIIVGGIASAEVFGTLYLAAGQLLIAPTGIASAETFGTVILVAGGRTLVVTGIATAQAFGTAIIEADKTLTPNGIASSETFGVPVVIRGSVAIVPQGAVSAEALGTPAIVMGAGVILPGPINSAEAFGNATVTVASAPAQSVTPAAVDTVEVFGVANIRTGNVNVIISGIGTAAVIPNPVLYSYREVVVTGITTAELLGLPVVAKGPAYIRPTGIASAEEVPSAALANLLDSWRWVNNSPALIGTRTGGFPAIQNELYGTETSGFPVAQSGLYGTTRQEGEG